MARPKGTQTRDRGADKRSQIVDAAMRTIVELGYSRASTRAIAERGGFNQALIHYYFGSLNAALACRGRPHECRPNGSLPSRRL